MRQYTPTEKPVAKDIQLPKRPKLDPKDPKEIYEMPTMPEFAFRQMQGKGTFEAQIRSQSGARTLELIM